jgi:hypothetical protein
MIFLFPQHVRHHYSSLALPLSSSERRRHVPAGLTAFDNLSP